MQNHSSKKRMEYVAFKITFIFTKIYFITCIITLFSIRKNKKKVSLFERISDKCSESALLNDPPRLAEKKRKKKHRNNYDLLDAQGFRSDKYDDKYVIMCDVKWDVTWNFKWDVKWDFK